MQNENQIQFNYTTKKIIYNILSRLFIMKILFFIFLKIFVKYFLERTLNTKNVLKNYVLNSNTIFITRLHSRNMELARFITCHCEEVLRRDNPDAMSANSKMPSDAFSHGIAASSEYRLLAMTNAISSKNIL